ncbi:hypothetical protein BH24BAC1_BH24BAC1_10440 [soil metagenome]
MVVPPLAQVLQMEEKASLTIHTKVKPHPFAIRKHVLSVTEEVISYRGQSFSFDQITDMRYGIESIPFYRDSLGVTYTINLQVSQRRMDLVFRSLFGLDDDFYSDLFSQLMDLIWEKAGERLVQEKWDLLQAGKRVEVGNCELTEDGLTFQMHSGFSTKSRFVSWDDLTYEKLYNRLVLNSSSDLTIYTNLPYTETWNVDVLIDILDRKFNSGGDLTQNSLPRKIND